LDHGYTGPRHFDSHAYRTSDYEDVKAFARGSMRSYKILEDKARRYNADRQIQALHRKIAREDQSLAKLVKRYSKTNAQALLEREFDRRQLAERPLPYEELDQLVFDLLLGAR
jgi:xylose isomerase